MHCCGETLKLVIWSCHAELELDCRVGHGLLVQRDCMRQGSQSRDQPVLTLAVMCVFLVSLLFCGMLAIGHVLKVTCQLIAWRGALRIS